MDHPEIGNVAIVALQKARHLASRAVIVSPDKRRAAQILSLRGGPTSLKHRSNQQATLDVVVGSGWLTSRPPRKIRSAPFFVRSRRADFTSRCARRLAFFRGECGRDAADGNDCHSGLVRGLPSVTAGAAMTRPIGVGRTTVAVRPVRRHHSPGEGSQSRRSRPMRSEMPA